ncbi:probable penicillinase antirepressor penJ [Rhodopirellula baltica SH 1]|uniref:Probable penicillinase antirepressor penJ n=1 Tax=Rhodopirellula baltica (strain DSM 10527 / NCIMB 13988 / SH1) TaxID=243090 RepID=Q7UFP0_RHOBA|nr:probable penicillinase antirepressor penJ [Rhodopirellula baltica SH 1]
MIWAALVISSIVSLVVMSPAMIAGRKRSHFSATVVNDLWRMGIVLMLILPIALTLRPSSMALWGFAPSSLGTNLPSAISADDVSVATGLNSEFSTAMAGGDVSDSTNVDRSFVGKDRSMPVSALNSAALESSPEMFVRPWAIAETISNLVMAVGWVWFAIASALLIRMLIGYVKVWSMVRAATEVPDPKAMFQLIRLPMKTTLSRARCFHSRDVEVPCVVPCWKPTILLPHDFERWSSDEQTAILQHELCHLLRHDVGWQFLANLLVVLYWFHPLAHHARRQLRRTAEFAADDAVLNAGFSADNYAENLIRIARGLTAHSTVAHLSAAVSEHSVRERVFEVLDLDKSRNPTNPRRRVIGWSISAATLLLLFSFAPSFATDPTEEPNWSQRIAMIRQAHPWIRLSDSFADEIERRQKIHRGERIDVRGQVLAKDQTPVAGALVLLRQRTNTTWMRGFQSYQQATFAYSWTDQNGAYDLRSIPTPWRGWNQSTAWETLILSPDHCVGTRVHPPGDLKFDDKTILLEPYQTISARFVDANNQPLPMQLNLAVLVDGRETSQSFNSLDFYDMNLMGSELPGLMQANEAGEVTIGGLPPNRLAVFNCFSPTNELFSFASQSTTMLRIATSPAGVRDPLIPLSNSRGSGEVHPFVENGVVMQTNETIEQLGGLREERLQLVPEVFGATDRRWGMQSDWVRGRSKDDITVDSRDYRVVKVKVVDAETKRPLPSVYVDWCDERRRPIRGPEDLDGHFPHTLTDDEGHAELVVPIEDVKVFAAGRYLGYQTAYDRLHANPAEPTSNPPLEQWVRSLTASTEDNEVTFELQPVTPLTVRCMDTNGDPVSADIAATDLAGSVNGFWKSATNQSGIASVPLLPTFESVRIDVQAGDLAPQSRTVDIGPENSIIEFILAP